MPKIKIVSLDIGAIFGVVVSLDGETAFTEEFKFKGFRPLEDKMKDYVRLWKPDLILIPFPTRFYNTIMKHAKMMGVICLVAEKMDLPVIEVQDARCKKVVLGSQAQIDKGAVYVDKKIIRFPDGTAVGKAKKEHIAKHYEHLKISSEHILDAQLFTDWYLLAIQ